MSNIKVEPTSKVVIDPAALPAFKRNPDVQPPEWKEPVTGFARPLTINEYAERLAIDAYPHLCEHAGIKDEWASLVPSTHEAYFAAARAVLEGASDREPSSDFERIVKDLLFDGWAKRLAAVKV